MQERKERIATLQAELRKLKWIDRCPHEPVSGIGGAVQRLRQSKGISIKKLADLARISAGLISKMETTADANPSLRTIMAIACALDAKVLNLDDMSFFVPLDGRSNKRSAR